MLNPKLETLPPKADPLFAESSKQTQMFKTQNSKPRDLEGFRVNSLLSFTFWVCLGFRV
jgi:hypothetical protein